MKNLLYIFVFALIFTGCSDVYPTIAPQKLELQGENTAVVEGLAGSVAVNMIPNDTTTTADDISVAWFDVTRILETGDHVLESELKDKRINVWFPRNELEKWNKINHKSAQILITKLSKDEYRFKLNKSVVVQINY